MLQTFRSFISTMSCWVCIGNVDRSIGLGRSVRVVAFRRLAAKKNMHHDSASNRGLACYASKLGVVYSSRLPAVMNGGLDGNAPRLHDPFKSFRVQCMRPV